VDFAAWIMDKRYASRVTYDETTDPKLSELNKKLIASEQFVDRQVRDTWKTRTVTEETVWYPYSNTSYYFASKYNLLNRKHMPPSINLVHSPILSITSLKCIIDGTETELIGNASYEEGWDEAYYVDYVNGIIEFKSFVPTFKTPVKVTYTHGNLESVDGITLNEATITGHTAATTGDTITMSLQSTTGEFNGKLIEITSGDADGRTYRVLTSSYNSTSTITTLTLLSGYTSSTDGVSTSDSLKILAVPPDIQEAICIDCFLGMKTVDPTYNYNLAYPPDEPTLNTPQIENLKDRLSDIISYRRQNISLVN